MQKCLKLLKLLVLSLVFCALAVVEKLISLSYSLPKLDSFNSKAVLVFCGGLQ